jgi:hypothetical protein
MYWTRRSRSDKTSAVLRLVEPAVAARSNTAPTVGRFNRFLANAVSADLQLTTRLQIEAMIQRDSIVEICRDPQRSRPSMSAGEATSPTDNPYLK